MGNDEQYTGKYQNSLLHVTKDGVTTTLDISPFGFFDLYILRSTILSDNRDELKEWASNLDLESITYEFDSIEIDGLISFFGEMDILEGLAGKIVEPVFKHGENANYKVELF